jgi:branched-chain amino acid transport system permease protein
MQQILIQGALLSGLYALIALGFTMIYGVGGVLNLAHAGYVMVAGYMYYLATYIHGFPVVVGFALAISVSTLLSVLTYLGWVKRFLDNPTVVFVSTIIMVLILEHVMTLAFFRENVNIPPILEGVTHFGGYSFSNNLIIALVASWVCIAGLLIFVRGTHIGRAIRALPMDRKGVIISGVDPNVVNLVVWASSGALAGVAGVFFGSYAFLTPNMWVTPLVMSFAIVIIGGLGSIEGTLIGAHIVGFMETVTVLAIDEKLRSVPGLVIMILVLLFRPKGVFGR